MAGVLKVSNMIWVIFSLLALGLNGTSVKRTGYSSEETERDSKRCFHISSMWSQFITNPCWIGRDTVTFFLLAASCSTSWPQTRSSESATSLVTVRSAFFATICLRKCHLQQHNTYSHIEHSQAAWQLSAS